MAVRVEAREAGVGAEAGRRLAAQVKEIVGVTCAVEVCEPGALERSAGKAKRVRDLR
jgi:phenylacetate-CoA ligase